MEVYGQEMRFIQITAESRCTTVPLKHKELFLVCGSKTSGWTDFILAHIYTAKRQLLVCVSLFEFKQVRGTIQHERIEFCGITSLHEPVFKKKKPVPTIRNAHEAHLVHLCQSLQH